MVVLGQPCASLLWISRIFWRVVIFDSWICKYCFLIFLLSLFYLRSVWLFVFKVSCFCTYPFIVCSSCLSKQTSLWCFSEFKNSCSTSGPNSGKFFNKSRRQNKPQNGQKQIFQICKESLKSILVKLVNLVDSPTIFLSQLTLFRWLKVVSVTVVLFCFA